MDIGLPDTNGIDLAKSLRLEREDFVLFLSAQNDPDIKVEGLEIGAEITSLNPFALKEIVIRLKRILETQENVSSAPLHQRTDTNWSDHTFCGPLRN